MADDSDFPFLAGIIFVILVLILIGVVLHRLYTSGTIGKQCGGNSDCTPGHMCDGNQKVCKVIPGGQCRTSSDCTSNSTCIGGVCTVNVIPPVPSRTTTATTVVPSTATSGVIPYSERTQTIDFGSTSIDMTSTYEESESDKSTIMDSVPSSKSKSSKPKTRSNSGSSSISMTEM